ncbi:BAG family molecular chaperone regulator 1-like [Coffea eugenioides]|uniref:BAG family molecular chaperone regulator 1-like n=1 Tax=Coffea eugenioides TaxID=49369 RepID=UPI000F61166E|nr:BAG family molecular chaperone regulator 1-like [Coffea eugenioides]
MNKDMLRMKPKVTGMSSPAKGGGNSEAGGWEVRPGGMLVQKRNIDSNQNFNVVPMIKVRVKYGSSYHEVNISSQASFGELKKMLAAPTGLHPQDQKLLYKDKERDSKLFLDIAGVKGGSKLVLIEDELSRERRCLESRKNAKMEKAAKEISTIRVEVDKLAKQVGATELEISAGKKVTESVLFNLIELLMTQLIKLDGITADGDVKLQRRMQVKRVQKYIETLDMLKMRNSTLGNNSSPRVSFQEDHRMFTGQMQVPIHNHYEQKRQTNFVQRSPGPVVVTTKWETF